jgi:hypothetical protein
VQRGSPAPTADIDAEENRRMCSLGAYMCQYIVSVEMLMFLFEPLLLEEQKLRSKEYKKAKIDMVFTAYWKNNYALGLVCL